METIISIINGAEQGNFIDWMIFICMTAAVIVAILGTWCWIGEKFLKITHLDEKFNRWVDANEDDE